MLEIDPPVVPARLENDLKSQLRKLKPLNPTTLPVLFALLMVCNRLFIVVFKSIKRPVDEPTDAALPAVPLVKLKIGLALNASSSWRFVELALWKFTNAPVIDLKVNKP